MLLLGVLLHSGTESTSRLTLEILRPAPSLASGGAAPHGETAVLVRSALDDGEQSRMYSDLCSAALGSYEWGRLSSDADHPPDRPWPLCVWCHPFTDETNANAEPVPVFGWAQSLARRAANQLRDDGSLAADEAVALGSELKAVEYDSLVSLLYRDGGSLQRHVDRGLDGLGIAVSLGAACTFEYGGGHVELRSGDALFAPFGHVPHQVVLTHAAASALDWWRAMPGQPGHDGGSGVAPPSTHFGRVRCSLQLRDASRRRAQKGFVRDAAAQRARAAAARL